MKIAITSRYYNKCGGASRYIAELAEHFSQEHEVHIFSVAWRDVHDLRIIFHKIQVFPYINFSSSIPCSRFLKRITLFLEVFTFMIETTIYFKIFGSKFDIVHTNADIFSGDVISAHSIYDTWRDYMITSGQKKRLSIDPVQCFLERWLYRKSHVKKIIAQAETGKQELIRYHHVAPEKIAVIPHAVDTEEFKSLPKSSTIDLRKKYDIPEENIVFYILATEFPRKGISELIQAFAILKKREIKNITLLIAGEGRPYGPGKYRKQAENLGVEGDVIFTGHVSDLNAYYNVGDIFVFPTKYEGFGIPILEAMAVGLPVITSRIGAGELITDDIDGIILKNPYDPNEIAEKMEKLVRDESLRKIMGMNARNTAMKYTWSETAQKTMDVYKEIIKEKIYARS